MESVRFNGVEYRVFDHLYAVARDGSLLRGMTPYTPTDGRRDGYLTAGRQRLVHRMVATCWLKKPEHANHVHHKDHDKRHNHANNLEWLTPKEHLSGHHKDNPRGHKMSEAGKAKLRKLRLGSTTSEETKAKQRAANLRLGVKPPPRPVGFKCSADSIHKMRINNPMNVGCEVFGVRYNSFADASRDIGVKLHTIRKRCLSENFPDYKLLKG